MRAKVDVEHVARLVEAVRSKAKLPPGKAFDDGEDLWLSRGFHRFYAQQSAGSLVMDVEVVKGTRRDAIADAMGDNAEHLALPRSNADKRRAVDDALDDAGVGNALRPRGRQTLRGQPHIRCRTPRGTRFRRRLQGFAGGTGGGW
jgi:hypothetical protein